MKLRGFRIELGEIESRLSGHRHIKEAVVLLDEGNGDTETHLCAYIVGQSGEALDLSKLREYLALVLPDYMIPAYFIPVDRVPLTPNGKVDRGALRGYAADGARLKPATTYAGAETHREKIAVGLWQEVLKLEQIGINDNFFEVGGNSTHILQLHLRLCKAFKRDIPVAALFRYPTIKSFLRHLDNEVPVDAVSDKEIGESVSLMEETVELWDDFIERE